jgi:hypothetical protein
MTNYAMVLRALHGGRRGSLGPNVSATFRLAESIRSASAKRADLAGRAADSSVGFQEPCAVDRKKSENKKMQAANLKSERIIEGES